MERKDKISMTLSVLAFSVSLTTALVTTIRQQDDLRATVRGDLTFSVLSKTDDKFTPILFSDQTLTVINVGNTSAALTDVRLLYRVTTKAKENQKDCTGEFSVLPYYRFIGSALKPGEVVVTRLRLNEESVREDSKDWIELSEPMPMTGKMYYTLCASFSVITPGEIIEDKRILLGTGHREKDASGGGQVGKETAKPFVLAKHFGTIFWR